MAYIGYFRSLHEDNLYSVTIKNKLDISTPKEITLSGEQPFVVRYEESSTPFEPFRNSTASIRVVSDNYMENILPNKPQEVLVYLTNETTGNIVWTGYLTPKVYSQGYENCIEEIELEASDVISSMQYVDFTSDGRGITSFKDIIVNMFDKTNINAFYWPLSKQTEGITITPDIIKVSTMNFFSNDTDEPWKEQEVLSEMCKYLGVTAIQYEDDLYFLDYTALNNSDTCRYAYYPKTASWNRSTDKNIGGKNTITGVDVMGNGETISFEPIYNKIVVKDNFYTCEEYITNIFDDEALTNRNGEFYSSFEITCPPINPNTGLVMEKRPTYPWKGSLFRQKYVGDGEDDDIYMYFHRLYDHKDFESVYRDSETLAEVDPEDKNGIDITKLYVGATILDLGRVRKEYVDDAYNTIIANKVDWERYLCISQMCKGWKGSPFAHNSVPKAPTDDMVVFRSKPNTAGQVLLNGSESYLVISYKVLFEKYRWRNYINPDWSKDSTAMCPWISGIEIHTFGRIPFRLGIGGKYWNGSNWVNDSSAYFIVRTFRTDEETFAHINTESEVLNNVSWELEIEEEGYKIPLEGIDTGGEIDFQIMLPSIQIITDYDDITPITKYNGYCWIKDFSIKTVNKGQDAEVEENDVVYENVIEEANVSDMSEIEFKYTTSVEGQKPSYSNVIIEINGVNQFLKQVQESGLSGTNQIPEENMIERYYNQYSTPTKKLNYTFNLDYTPFGKFYGMDVDNPDTGYVCLGSEIDYARNTQQITLIEKK